MMMWMMCGSFLMKKILHLSMHSLMQSFFLLYSNRLGLPFRRYHLRFTMMMTSSSSVNVLPTLSCHYSPKLYIFILLICIVAILLVERFELDDFYSFKVLHIHTSHEHMNLMSFFKIIFTLMINILRSDQ